MKKVIFVLFSLAVVFVAGISVFAQERVGLIINESGVETDQAPFIEDGTTFVPVRIVSEKLGCTVTWIEDQQRIDIEKDGMVFSLYIGMDYAITENGPVHIPKAPRIVNSRTMVPIRAVAELLDCEVDWLESTNTVYIDSPVILKQDSVAGLSKIYPEKDWVYTADTFEETYVDGVGNEYHPRYAVPAININSADAGAINYEIRSDIESLYQNTLELMSEGNSLYLLNVYYEYYVNGDIVSVCVIYNNDMDTIEGKWYNISKATGRKISNTELVMSLGYTGEKFVEKLKEVAGQYYLETTAVNASVVGEDFYRDRYNYTVSDEACNLNVPLYVGENGHLYAVLSIGSLAGASRYNHVVDTGIEVNSMSPEFTVGRALECIGVWSRTTRGLQGLLPRYTKDFITVHPDVIDTVITDPGYNGYTVPAYRINGADTREEVTDYILEYVTEEAEKRDRLTEIVFDLGAVEYNGVLYAYELGYTGIHFFKNNARQIEDSDGYKRIAVGADHYNSEWIFCFKIEDGRWKIDRVIEAEN